MKISNEIDFLDPKQINGDCLVVMQGMEEEQPENTYMGVCEYHTVETSINELKKINVIGVWRNKEYSYGK